MTDSNGTDVLDRRSMVPWEQLGQCAPTLDRCLNISEPVVFEKDLIMGCLNAGGPDCVSGLHRRVGGRRLFNGKMSINGHLSRQTQGSICCIID